MKINFKKSIYILLLAIFSLSFSLPVQAGLTDDISDQLGEFNQEANLPAGSNLTSIIINIIDIVLGFLAVVFVILIIIAGFKYMTAGGNTENAKSALVMIRNSVIGVIIILLAGVFVNFVLEKLLEVM